MKTIFILLITKSPRTSAPHIGCWMLGVGCWMLDVGCWVLDVGCWVLDVGCWMLDVGCWVLDVGCWMLDVGCWMFDVFHNHQLGLLRQTLPHCLRPSVRPRLDGGRRPRPARLAGLADV